MGVEEDFLLLAVPGTLRRRSYNGGLLRAAAETAPAGIGVDFFVLHEIPPYDADVEAAGAPEPVRVLKDAIAAADALLFATPEYNHALPGVLKNALDWASRPPETSPLHRKPAAVMGATPGGFGTAQAQAQLRHVLTMAGCYVMPAPRVYVSHAARHFDANGNLTDDVLREAVRELVDALVVWAGVVAPVAAPSRR